MSEATDIALLFARDPLQHSDQDIDAIIKRLRESRHLFNSSPAKSKVTKEAKPVNLGDLKLSL